MSVRRSVRAMAVFLGITCLLSCADQTPPTVQHLVPHGVSEEPVAVGKVSRMGFRSTSGTEHRVTFAVPRDGPKLWIACAVAGEDEAPGAAPGYCRALLRDDAGDSHVVFGTAVMPHRWSGKVVDLASFAGQRVELLLLESSGPHAEQAVYWATPVVTSRSRGCPNVLLICIDSLRADHLSCYGYQRRTTPTLDSLASEGCRFTRAVAQSSWTLPSHASLFSSLHMKTHGVRGVRKALRPSVTTLAEVVRDSGYLTAAVISGGPMLPVHGLAQGFDVYDAGCRRGGRIGTEEVTNPCTHRRAATALGLCAGAPFFLFVHYWDVHFDYLPPAPYDTLFDPGYGGPVDGRLSRHAGHMPRPLGRTDAAHLVALYDGEIAHTDRYLRRLFDEVARRGLSENTLVVVTSDHGDEFFEHGTTGHCHTLFQELIHVPLIWSEPRPAVAPRVVEDLVQLVDIAPTVLEYLGQPVPDEMEGTSFLSRTRGGSEHPRPAFSQVEAGGGLTAVLTNNTKLIFSSARRESLCFDLAADPTEQRPLAPGDLSTAPRLGVALGRFLPERERTPVRLELRVMGVGPRGSFVLELTSPALTAAHAVDLEPGDSLAAAPGGNHVILMPDCRAGDTDGLSLELASGVAALHLSAMLDGEPLPAGKVFLGAGEHPEEILPLKIRADAPSIQAAPGHQPRLGPVGPAVCLWAVGPEADGVAVKLDPELERDLRALGYLQ